MVRNTFPVNQMYSVAIVHNGIYLCFIGHFRCSLAWPLRVVGWLEHQLVGVSIIWSLAGLVSRARPFFPCWWAWPEVRRGKKGLVSLGHIPRHLQECRQIQWNPGCHMTPPKIFNFLTAIGTCRELLVRVQAKLCAQRRLLSVLNESKQPSLCPWSGSTSKR